MTDGKRAVSLTIPDMNHHRPPQDLKRRIIKDALREDQQRDAAFRRIIRSVPKGKVSTYGKVAAAAGYPLYHRAVAQLLRKEALNALPWQRIVGAGGQIKLHGDAAQASSTCGSGWRVCGSAANVSTWTRANTSCEVGKRYRDDSPSKAAIMRLSADTSEPTSAPAATSRSTTS